MGKKAKDVAQSDYLALQDQPGLNYSRFGGGGSDNAAVALLGMLELVDKVDTEHTDQTEAVDGDIMRPDWNGVQRNPWATGSVISQASSHHEDWP